MTQIIDFQPFKKWVKVIEIPSEPSHEANMM